MPPEPISKAKSSRYNLQLFAILSNASPLMFESKKHVEMEFRLFVSAEANIVRPIFNSWAKLELEILGGKETNVR